MDSFAARATVFTMGVVGILMIGFSGFSYNVDVKWGSCESHFQRFHLKPFLVPLACSILKIKPCGDFVEHRAMMSHIQMYECLCRDPQGNAGNLRAYSTEYHKDSGLTGEPDEICFKRPRNAPL